MFLQNETSLDLRVRPLEKKKSRGNSYVFAKKLAKVMASAVLLPTLPRSFSVYTHETLDQLEFCAFPVWDFFYAMSQLGWSTYRQALSSQQCEHHSFSGFTSSETFQTRQAGELSSRTNLPFAHSLRPCISTNMFFFGCFQPSTNSLTI